jgi:histidinol dehydrogenase
MYEPLTGIMIVKFELDGKHEIDVAVSGIRLASRVPDEVAETVAEIIEEVRTAGDEAVAALTLRYDGVDIDPGEFEVSAEEVERSYESAEEEVREALDLAAKRIGSFARRSLSPEWVEEVSSGLTVGQLRRPFDSAGLYVPGGRFAYPSTVLMTGVPAVEAGVGEICFCIPPDREGRSNLATLAATRLIPGCKVFRIGGAQAIAAMALGTRCVPRCQMIAGPGNVYVTCAKRLLSGDVSVDIEAGPSEVAVYIDSRAKVEFAVADMLAQIEHDPLSTAVMVSEDREVLDYACNDLEREGGPGGDGRAGNIIMVSSPDKETSIAFLNRLAPEHLELMVELPERVLGRVEAAGAVFVGAYSPVVMGDYVAGPSHVLPTGGRATRMSGLSPEDFRRTINMIAYERSGFEADAPLAKALSVVEGLSAHARSIEVRMEKASGDSASEVD